MTTTTTTTTRTYCFPISREQEFLARASKTPKVFQPYALVRVGERRSLTKDGLPGPIVVTYEWSGPTHIVKEGWGLAARVEWVDGKGASTVFIGGGANRAVKVPEAPTCDHCKARRHRSTTYVALATDGSDKTLVLGGDCAKLYWGKALKYLPFWEDMEAYDVGDGADEEGMGGYGGPVPRAFFDTRTLLSLAIPHIRKNGYTPASAEMGVPTKWAVADLQKAFDMWGPGPVTVPPHLRPAGLEGIDEVVVASDEDVDAVIEWAREQALSEANADSTYWRTVGEALDKGWFGQRVLGFIAALPHGYAKRPVAATTAAAQPVYRHVGVEGQRMKTPMKLTVMRTMTFDTMYGPSVLTILRDEDGNTLKSFGKMPRELREEGDTAPVTFFVKAHGEYKGMPETIINRVS